MFEHQKGREEMIISVDLSGVRGDFFLRFLLKSSDDGIVCGMTMLVLVVLLFDDIIGHSQSCFSPELTCLLELEDVSFSEWQRNVT